MAKVSVIKESEVLVNGFARFLVELTSSCGSILGLLLKKASISLNLSSLASGFGAVSS